MAIEEKAYAKLNISLDVTGSRPDGFHDMLMIMQTVDIMDTISLSLKESPGVSSECNLKFIPSDEKNLAVKAAKAFLKAAEKETQGISIKMTKSIPVGAGMAGGSADAAAVIRGLDRLCGTNFGRGELELIARQVGSDVPFCIAGGTALAKGRGELLTDLPPMPECEIVVCKPSFSISTPELFKKLDSTRYKCHPDTEGILTALDSGNLRDICRRMYNVFEEIDDRRMKTVSAIKSVLLDCGALGAVMTGTGSAVFGVFTPGADTKEAEKRLQADYAFCRSCRCSDRLI